MIGTLGSFRSWDGGPVRHFPDREKKDAWLVWTDIAQPVATRPGIATGQVGGHESARSRRSDLATLATKATAAACWHGAGMPQVHVQRPLRYLTGSLDISGV